MFYDAVGWSALCDCGIFLSYSRTSCVNPIAPELTVTDSAVIPLMITAP